jgi:hypothetical protein
MPGPLVFFVTRKKEKIKMFKVFLVSFILIFSCQLYSQDKNTIGVKLGFINSEFEKNNSNASLDLFKKSRVGPSFDIFYKSPRYRFFNIEFSIGYMQKGAKDKIEITTPDFPNGTGEEIKIDYKLDYFRFASSVYSKHTIGKMEVQPFIGLSSSILFDDNWSSSKDLETVNFGYFFGLTWIINNTLKNPLFFEISKDIDFGYFYSDSRLKLSNRLWSFKVGFFYRNLCIT